MGVITTSFGPWVNPFTGIAFFHAGIDIGWKIGQAIVAAQSGTVTETGQNDDEGVFIRISDGAHISTSYAHIESIAKQKGDTVAAGETIGTLGNTGLSTGPHVHFEVSYDGALVDPLTKLLPLETLKQGGRVVTN